VHSASARDYIMVGARNCCSPEAYAASRARTLRRLKTPTLGVWGELDNNVLAEKNRAAWDAALKAAGNRDYTLEILRKADRAQWEAVTGSIAETKSLRRFVPEYFSTVRAWLDRRRITR